MSQANPTNFGIPSNVARILDKCCLCAHYEDVFADKEWSSSGKIDFER